MTFLRVILLLCVMASSAAAAVGNILSVVIRPDGESADVTVEGFSLGASYNLYLQAPWNRTTASTPRIDLVGKGYVGINPSNRSRTVHITNVSRKPYPGEGSKDETIVSGNLVFRVWLSHPIYATDNVGTGNSGFAPLFSAPAGFVTNAGGAGQSSLTATNIEVVNNSTLQNPDTMGHWDWYTTKPYTRKTTDFQVGYRAVHELGISAVQLDAIGAVSNNTVSQIITSVTKVGPTRSGKYFDSYVMTVPIANFQQGEQIILRARVYPKFGDASNIIDTETVTTIQQNGLSRIEVTCDKTEALVKYGVVKTVAAGGSNTSGQISTSLATARTTPYATVDAAIAANATVVILTDDDTGTHTPAQFPIKSQPYCIEIRPDPLDVASNITLNWALGLSSVRCKHLALIGAFNVSIAAGSYFFDGDQGTYNSTFLVDGVRWNTASTSNNADAVDWRLANFINVDFTNFKLTRFSTTAFCWSAMGCIFRKPAATGAINSFGAFVANAQGGTGYRLAVTDGLNTNPVYIGRNIFFDYNSLDYYDINNTQGFTLSDMFDGDVSIRGNLIVNIDTQEGDNFFFNNVAIDNILVAHNTFVGTPFASAYNVTGSYAVRNYWVQGNAFYRQSTKTDTFDDVAASVSKDGTRVGNWPYVFGVGVRNNRIDGSVGFLPGETGGKSPAGFNGINAGLVGSDSNYTELGYTDDKSLVGPGGPGIGGGDYRPTIGSVLRQAMPASEAHIVFDQYGTYVPTSGMMDIGAALNAPPANTAPVIDINEPTTGANTTSPVNLVGTAIDDEDGDISAQIVWSSNVDGVLGTGDSISATLSAGSHTITASITDSGASTVTTTINITIGPSPGTLNSTTTNATTVTIQ